MGCSGSRSLSLQQSYQTTQNGVSASICRSLQDLQTESGVIAATSQASPKSEQTKPDINVLVIPPPEIFDKLTLQFNVEAVGTSGPSEVNATSTSESSDIVLEDIPMTEKSSDDIMTTMNQDTDTVGSESVLYS